MTPTGSDADTRAGDKSQPCYPHPHLLRLTDTAPENGVSLLQLSLHPRWHCNQRWSADTAVEITTDADLDRFLWILLLVLAVTALPPSWLKFATTAAAPAPDSEDAHIPYAVEAGQGT